MSGSGRALFIIVMVMSGILHAKAQEMTVTRMEPKTYELTKDSVLIDEPFGKIVDIWFAGRRLTAYEKMGSWVKVSGYFPNGKWVKSEEPVWIDESNLKTLLRMRPPRKRPAGTERYIIVDKSDYELKVIEKRHEKKRILYKAKVAVGMDRCLPEEEGGNCYFTDPGTYKVRWKVYDPKGIEWCIPKFMEKEKKYQEDLQTDKRCFRGSLGYYALNIGKSYAIHGTNNEASIGSNASHGCVRTRNKDMEKIFRLMEEGDKVYIVR